MLRYSADRRPVGYLAFTVFLAVLQWKFIGFHPVLYALYLFMSCTGAGISHNHNHLSMWKVRPLNLLTSYGISIPYGPPAIAWFPTANPKPHKINKPPW